MRLSFQKRLLLGVMMLVFSITATLGVVGVRYGASFLRERFEDRMSFLARYLALNAELGIILGDRAMLRRLAENLLEERDVVEVIIEDADCNVLVREGARGRSVSGEAVADVMLRQGEEEMVFMDSGYADRRLGRVHVLYTTAGIAQLMDRLRNVYMAAAIIFSVLGVLVFSMFSRSLVAPLKALVDAAERVARGELDVKVGGGGIPEIGRLAEAFNNMLTALARSRAALEETYQEMIQQKAMADVGRFAFTVAHEIKNPLGIIKGALDVVKKPEIENSTKETMIRYMEEEILRVDRIIQDFLNFSRPRKPVFRDLDLVAMVEALVEKNRIDWEGRGVSLHMESSCSSCNVLADEDYLAQALLNIVLNACEACGDQGDVWIRVFCSENEWSVEVEDTGKGVDENDLQRITEPFFTTKSSGTGLGLALVDRVVKLHGGDMLFSRNDHGGLTVRITAPM